MPTPKRKLSRSRRDSRSANKGITPKSFSICKTELCFTPLLGHTVCRGCGMYKGKAVVAASQEYLDKKKKFELNNN